MDKTGGNINELALFAGAGGGLLASQLLGWDTRCAVELDAYCRCVLIKRQNERHFRTSFPIWDDIRTFDGRPWRGAIDVVTGGFPCQAYSTAARGRNNAECLFGEMQRVVYEVKPRYVFAENVSRKAIDSACEAFDAMGYETRAIPLSAKDLGADHIRKRYWLLAYADDKTKLLRGINAKAQFMQKLRHGVWSSSPFESGVADGVAARMDRIKATGNGQVSIVAAAALLIMANGG